MTGLGIKTSDVDCYIKLPNVVNPSPRHVIIARNILRQKCRLFTNLFAITTAKVPIVKFLHIPTNCNCDVNFKSPAGVFNSQLIGHLLHMDPGDRVLKLAILVKYWSKVHKITGTNLLASYALTLMVIFYLQLMDILPPIMVLQKDVPPVMIDNWNMGFNQNITSYSNNNVSLYNLLGGFFKCYSTLNFEENIISPYMGRLLNKSSFKKLEEVPSEFELYKRNISENVYKPLNIDSSICIQDPFEHARNCSGAVHPRLALKIKSHFEFAAKMFDELPSDHFLRAILTEDPSKISRIIEQKPKHVFHNKVTKRKGNRRQRKQNRYFDHERYRYISRRNIESREIKIIPEIKTPEMQLAADIKQETLQIKQETAQIKQETVQIKQETVQIKQEIAQIKQEHPIVINDSPPNTPKQSQQTLQPYQSNSSQNGSNTARSNAVQNPRQPNSQPIPVISGYNHPRNYQASSRIKYTSPSKYPIYVIDD